MRTLAVVATLIAATSIASAAPFVTFTTVDEFERTSAQFMSITGISSGQSTSQTVQIQTLQDGNQPASASGDACERAALMMMNRPGRWTLQINPTNGRDSCRLVKQ